MNSVFGKYKHVTLEMDEGHAWNFQRDGGRLGLVCSGTQVGQRSSVQHFNVIISNCKFTEAKMQKMRRWRRYQLAT